MQPIAAKSTATYDRPSARPVPMVAGLGATFAFRRDPIGFLRTGVERHGDIFGFRVLRIPLILINHPDYVQHVFVDFNENYDKNSWLYRAVEPVLRNGLIGNPGGEYWRRQRRIMNPSFTPNSVALFARYMTEETVKVMDRWAASPGVGGVVDVSADMGELALTIVSRTLFSASVAEHVLEMQRAFYEANTLLASFFRFPFPPLTVPTPRNRRLRQLIGIVDDIIIAYINERMSSASAQHEPDLLSMLMSSVDEETGETMSTEQLKHEVLNVGIGAYETTTNTIAWALYLLATHPDADRRVRAEVTDVCGDSVPRYEDLPRLRYTRMVIDETLRLYSPAWQTMRRAVSSDTIDGYDIPAGSNVYLNSYLLHRHPDFWQDPEAFIPERFSDEASASRPKHVYMPFGGGPRTCLGKYFALTELQLVLATISQRFRLTLAEGAPPVEAEPLITLHPKGGVHLVLERA
jgi:cytochrome P450